MNAASYDCILSRTFPHTSSDDPASTSCRSDCTSHGLAVRNVNKVAEGRPHIVDLIKNDEAAMIINTTEGRRAILDSASIRASAEQHKVFYTTTLAAAEAVCMALEQETDITVRRLQDLHESIAL